MTMQVKGLVSFEEEIIKLVKTVANDLQDLDHEANFYCASICI